MQPHPIPQNVTTFQFHLVGDMTLKQFIYLAIGSGIAYLIFVLFAVDYPVFAWPLVLISALLGVAFAFLPINARPLDYWTKAFLKAIYSPTKRVWKKNNISYNKTVAFTSRLITYLSALQPIQQPRAAPANTQPASVQPPIMTTAIPPAVAMPKQEIPQVLPTQEELGKTVDLARQAQSLQMKIIQTERTLNQIKSSGLNQLQMPVDYTSQVNKVLADLQNLMTQASQIKQQLEQVQAPAQTKVQQKISEPQVKVVVPVKPKITRVALTSFPNVINGFVKDVNGSSLEGVVVVIYDKEGLPVRALKTNKLGQFTGSTPLPNGTYRVEIEKEGYVFDVLQMELNGELLSPLTITAKQPAVS